MIRLSEEEKKQGYCYAQYEEDGYLMECILNPNGDKVDGTDEIIEPLYDR